MFIRIPSDTWFVEHYGDYKKCPDAVAFYQSSGSEKSDKILNEITLLSLKRYTKNQLDELEYDGAEPETYLRKLERFGRRIIPKKLPVITKEK